MSLSIPSHKFLLDENVKRELLKFLKNKGFDVILPPKSAPDPNVASISKKERRILVTNDEDFSHYGKDEIFSIVWLNIPQNDSKALITSFEKLLESFDEFSGKLIVLKPGKWDEFMLNGERAG